MRPHRIRRLRSSLDLFFALSTVVEGEGFEPSKA
jgi:hypothetical protein